MKKRSDKAWYALFVLPLVFIFTTVVIIPFFIGIGYSFFSWDGMALNPKIFVGFGTSMAVFLYHGFVKSIPISLEEAATIDGCTKFGVFWKIVFPMLKPTTATVMILDVIFLWTIYD